MAREQSSFNYDDLDSATQDFLRQKEKDIKLLISEVGLKPALTGRYRIGEKVVEVRSDLEKNKVKYWVAWIEKVLSMRHGSIYDEYVYLYNYTNDFLGGIAVLEANPKIRYSVLCKLGRPKTPVNIKQTFAERIKLGERIVWDEVDEAIARECPEKVKIKNSSNGLKSSRNSNQSYNLEIAVIKLKELLDNQEKKRSKVSNIATRTSSIIGI